MLFVCNLRNIHSLANIVILFAIKTCQPCHSLNQLLEFTRASATRIKTRVSGLPTEKMSRNLKSHKRFSSLCLQLQHTDYHVLYATSKFEAGITTTLN